MYQLGKDLTIPAHCCITFYWFFLNIVSYVQPKVSVATTINALPICALNKNSNTRNVTNNDKGKDVYINHQLHKFQLSHRKSPCFAIRCSIMICTWRSNNRRGVTLWRRRLCRMQICYSNISSLTFYEGNETVNRHNGSSDFCHKVYRGIIILTCLYWWQRK